jgi:hypothetical protein
MEMPLGNHKRIVGGQLTPLSPELRDGLPEGDDHRLGVIRELGYQAADLAEEAGARAVSRVGLYGWNSCTTTQ